MPPPEYPRPQNSDQPPRSRPVTPYTGLNRRPISGGQVPPRPVVERRPPFPDKQPPAGPDAQREPPHTPEVPAPALPQANWQPTADNPEPSQPVTPTPVQHLTFEPPAPTQPPPKPKRRHLKLPPLKFLAAGLLVILVLGGLVALVSNQSGRNKPDKVFADALTSALATTKVQVESTSQQQHIQSQLDYSEPKNITSSTSATIGMDGGSFDIKAYGNAKNSYISYQKLPTSVSAKLNQAVQGGWLQLRTNGRPPLGAPASLSNLADPRYQAFGPLLLANLPLKLQQQLVSFNSAHHVYAYDPKQVAKVQIAGGKAYKFIVKPNVGYLKIMADSAATSEGWQPADILAATDALDALKGTTMNVYVAAHGHRFAKLETSADGVNQTITYSHYGSAQPADEPSTRLNWTDFASVQWQMEAQVAAHQTAPALDKQRKTNLASLHPYLAQYFAQNSDYPSLANLNSPGWLSVNLPAIDPALLRDPLATNLLLSATPKTNAFTYQPIGDNAAVACAPTTANPCAHYRLIASLSNGQQFIVRDP